MIGVNLNPGGGSGGRRPSKGSRRGAPNQPETSGATSKWRTFALLAWIVVPATAGWTHVTGVREANALRDSIVVARADSARLAEIHAANTVLRAREDTIRRKLDVINGIDHGRFVWAHIVDELSRSLPQHVWLTEVVFLSNETPLDAPRFAVLGRAGTTFALTHLLQALEASPFLTTVTLIQTAQVVEGQARVYSFAIEAQYRAPPKELLDLVPVLDAGGD